jgi:hypothetical protein
MKATIKELREARKLCLKDAASEKDAGLLFRKDSSVYAFRNHYSRLLTLAADCVRKQIARRLADKKRRAMLPKWRTLDPTKEPVCKHDQYRRIGATEWNESNVQMKYVGSTAFEYRTRRPLKGAK